MSRLRPLRPVGAPLATTAELSALVSELSRAKRVTVLSGAGISTESGLSDYRSPGRPGPRRPPISHHEFVGDAAVRARYWTRSFVGFPALSGTRPNPTHLALAALHEQDARWAKHVTQNVDGLLFAAGMKDDALVELHGSVHWLKCGECNGLESREHFQGRLAELNGQWATQLSQVQFRPDGDAELDDALVDGFVVPSCAKCDAENLMPGVVFHGGQVPLEITALARQRVDESDALLVLGSTCTTYSAYSLVKRTKERNAFVACVNFGPTRADPLFDIKVEAVLSDAVPRLADAILPSGYTPSAPSLKSATSLAYASPKSATALQL